MKTPERVRRALERRRSNAAQPIPSRKAYKRRDKHRKKETDS